MNEDPPSVEQHVGAAKALHLTEPRASVEERAEEHPPPRWAAYFKAGQLLAREPPLPAPALSLTRQLHPPDRETLNLAHPGEEGAERGEITIQSGGTHAGTLYLPAVATAGGTAARDVTTISGSHLNDASVSPSGVVSFSIADAGGSWTYSGTLAGDKITGRTLTDGVNRFSGDWTGTRP